MGRPSRKPKVFYHSFQYQAKSWQRSRRVVAKVEWHTGELFPRVGFIVTNSNKHSKNVVKFYNGRGTAEQWIKEGKNAVKWTKLSCRTFKDNQTRLQLFALAYNLANFLRRLAQLPHQISDVACFQGWRAQSRHYISVWFILGGWSLRRSRRICWWSVGLERQRVRISIPVRVGRMTSIILSSPNSSKTRRGSLPRPARSHIWPSVFHNTYARKQTKMWAKTRSSF